MSSNYTLTSPLDVKSTTSSASQINVYPGSASTFSVQLTAPSSLTSDVQFILPSSNGSVGQYLQWGTGIGGSSEWGTVISSNPTSTLPSSYQFASTTGVPASITSNTFITLGRCYYGGTTTDNTIQTAIAVVQTSNTTATGQVQLFDYTNNLIIATSAVYGPYNPANIPKIINLGVISNLPTGNAILEFRIRRVNVGGGGAGNTSLYSFQLLG
jgi:hypothetical protein